LALSLSEEPKASVREILYSRPPTDEQLEEFTGVEHIRQLRFNDVPGKANSYNVHVFRYKIEKIVELLEQHKEDVPELYEAIMAILRSKPKGTELAENSGVSSASISASKKNNSYGYQYHLLSWMIEQIAKEVDAG